MSKPTVAIAPFKLKGSSTASTSTFERGAHIGGSRQGATRAERRERHGGMRSIGRTRLASKPVTWMMKKLKALETDTGKVVALDKDKGIWTDLPDEDE